MEEEVAAEDAWMTPAGDSSCILIDQSLYSPPRLTSQPEATALDLSRDQSLSPSSFRELARRQRKNERSRFKRRQDRLFEYSDEFGKLFNLKLYLLVQSKEGVFSIYENRKDFPPSRSALELLSLPPVEHSPNPKPSFEHNTPQTMEEEGEGRFSSRARMHSKSKFDRLQNRLLGYANNFARQFSANVYLLIQLQSGNIVDYSSSSSKSWPPSKKQVRLLCPSAKRREPSDFDKVNGSYQYKGENTMPSDV